MSTETINQLPLSMLTIITMVARALAHGWAFAITPQDLYESSNELHGGNDMHRRIMRCMLDAESRYNAEEAIRRGDHPGSEYTDRALAWHHTGNGWTYASPGGRVVYRVGFDIEPNSWGVCRGYVVQMTMQSRTVGNRVISLYLGSLEDKGQDWTILSMDGWYTIFDPEGNAVPEWGLLSRMHETQFPELLELFGGGIAEDCLDELKKAVEHYEPVLSS